MIIPDTNLFYAGGTDLASLATKATIAPSVISALEILCAETDGELPRRQQAARNWLKYASEAVIDNEVAHAVELGYSMPPDYVKGFVTALTRFIELPDISAKAQGEVGLDLNAAVVAKEEVSARFVSKVGAIFGAYRSQVASAGQAYGQKIPYAISHEETLVRKVVLHFRSNVEAVHFDRIDALASELNLAGSNTRDASKIAHYIDLYLEFIIMKISEGSPHINDYVDLQFFAYLDLGHSFASKEKKWNTLAQSAGKGSQFIFIP